MLWPDQEKRITSNGTITLHMLIVLELRLVNSIRRPVYLDQFTFQTLLTWQEWRPLSGPELAST